MTETDILLVKPLFRWFWWWEVEADWCLFRRSTDGRWFLWGYLLFCSLDKPFHVRTWKDRKLHEQSRVFERRRADWTKPKAGMKCFIVSDRKSRFLFKPKKKTDSIFSQQSVTHKHSKAPPPRGASQHRASWWCGCIITRTLRGERQGTLYLGPRHLFPLPDNSIRWMLFMGSSGPLEHHYCSLCWNQH